MKPENCGIQSVLCPPHANLTPTPVLVFFRRLSGGWVDVGEVLRIGILLTKHVMALYH